MAVQKWEVTWQQQKHILASSQLLQEDPISKATCLPLGLNQGFQWGQKGDWPKLIHSAMAIPLS